MINRYVPVAPLEKNGIYFPQVEKGRENLLVRGFWIVEYRQFEFKFHHRFICEASMWRTSKQIFFLFGSHFMGCIGYILGCASACRESFRVFTFRSCNMAQPAGRYTYCQSKARYLCMEYYLKNLSLQADAQPSISESLEPCTGQSNERSCGKCMGDLAESKLLTNNLSLPSL